MRLLMYQLTEVEERRTEILGTPLRTQSLADMCYYDHGPSQQSEDTNQIVVFSLLA